MKKKKTEKIGKMGGKNKNVKKKEKKNYKVKKRERKKREYVMETQATLEGEKSRN